MNIDWLDVGIKLALLHLGMLIFFGRKVIASKLHDSDGDPKLSDYWRKNPVQTLVSVAGAYSGFLLLYGSDEMTKSAALGLGYMADSIADAVVAKTKNKVEDKI